MGKCKDCGAELGGSASTKDYRDHYKICPKRKVKKKVMFHVVIPKENWTIHYPTKIGEKKKEVGKNE
jgi:hypothetical protein